MKKWFCVVSFYWNPYLYVCKLFHIQQIVTLSKLLVLSQVSCLNANFYQKEVLKLTFMTNINVVYPFVCTIVNEAIQEDLEGSNEKLTYPSGCNLIRYFFLLKLSFRIFAQENVFILVKFWKTSTPMWATARFKGTPSWS